jgi:hypothetical protein
MSHDKAIESGEEHRKPYRKAKRWVKGCRNHNSCDYCRGNRLHRNRKALAKAKEGENDA